jgi:hypothetical protein
MIDFENEGGYQLLTDMLFKCSTDESHMTHLDGVLRSFYALAFIGQRQLPYHIESSPFQKPSFKPPKPSDDGNTIRNLKIDKILSEVYSRQPEKSMNATDVIKMQYQLLETVLDMMKSDDANYFLMMDSEILTRLINGLDYQHEKINVIIFILSYDNLNT